MTASGTFTTVEHGYTLPNTVGVFAIPSGPRAEETARTCAKEFGGTYVRRIVTVHRTRWSPS